MLYPEWWRGTSSFWVAVLLPNVLPRYLHFVAASLALTGLFLSWYLARPALARSLALETLTVADLRRTFLGVTFAATLAQLFVGPLVFMTLPSRAVSAVLIGLLFLVVLLAGTVLWAMWRDLRDPQPGRRLGRIVTVLGLIVSVMVFARHEVRETAVAPHRAAMAVKTAAYVAHVRLAQTFLMIPGGLGGRAESAGAALFRQTCGSCHALDRRLVGPPLVEVAKLYAGNPGGIVTWALSPGKKRPDYPQMPAQTLSRADLTQIAGFILEAGGK